MAYNNPDTTSLDFLIKRKRKAHIIILGKIKMRKSVINSEEVSSTFGAVIPPKA